MIPRRNLLHLPYLTKIYTPHDPDSRKVIRPTKLPYIILTFNPKANTLENDFLCVRNLAKLHELDLGTIRIHHNRQIGITITGNRKVIKAIDILLTKELDEDTRSHLIAYQAAYKVGEKQPMIPPPKSKAYSLFEKKKAHLRHGVNQTFYVIRKEKPDKGYIFKCYPNGRYISELEAFNGYCYRLLLGERHPKVRGVHDDQGKRKGVISQRLDSFKSFHTLDYKLSQQELLHCEIVKVLVAAYVEEENDLHGGNYGIDSSGFCVKIDDDQSTWPLTSKYAMVDPTYKEPSIDYLVPSLTFAVTKANIQNIYCSTNTAPFSWADQEPAFFGNIPQIQKEKKFVEDTYYMFLKRILIPNAVYEAIGTATISSEKKRKEFVDHKCERTKQLREVLFTIPEFCNYIVHHPKVIDSIIKEFTQYNKDYKKEKDAYLRVDLSIIRENFKEFQEEAITSGVPAESLTRNILVGLGIGVAIVAVVALVAVTAGGALPILLGLGAAIGSAFGLGGVAAPAVGLTILGISCVAVAAGIAGWMGSIKRRCLNSNLSAHSNNLSTGANTTTIINRLTSGKSPAAPAPSFSQHEHSNQKQKADINMVVCFLIKKLEFFAAPFTQLHFQTWAQNNAADIKPLSDALISALPSENEQQIFAQALEALKNNQKENIRILLKNNQKLLKTLKTHMANSIIDKWYRDANEHLQLKVARRII